MKPKDGRYGAWRGCPGGWPEDKARCVEEVWPKEGDGWVPHQCYRRRGHGPNGEYCAQHGQMAEREGRK